jgi:hypothetical protein
LTIPFAKYSLQFLFLFLDLVEVYDKKWHGEKKDEPPRIHQQGDGEIDQRPPTYMGLRLKAYGPEVMTAVGFSKSISLKVGCGCR